MKVESYDRYLWPTKAAAKLVVGDWIERVYNRSRRHLAMGMISPVDYGNRITQTPDPVSTKPGQAQLVLGRPHAAGNDQPRMARRIRDARIERLLRACVRDRHLIPEEKSVDISFHRLNGNVMPYLQELYQLYRRGGVELTPQVRRSFRAICQ